MKRKEEYLHTSIYKSICFFFLRQQRIKEKSSFFFLSFNFFLSFKKKSLKNTGTQIQIDTNIQYTILIQDTSS